MGAGARAWARSCRSGAEMDMARKLFEPRVLLALALMAIIVMMVLPVPAWLIDAGLALSFALAILIFTLTLFIDRQHLRFLLTLMPSRRRRKLREEEQPSHRCSQGRKQHQYESG